MKVQGMIGLTGRYGSVRQTDVRARTGPQRTSVEGPQWHRVTASDAEPGHPYAPAGLDSRWSVQSSPRNIRSRQSDLRLM